MLSGTCSQLSSRATAAVPIRTPHLSRTVPYAQLTEARRKVANRPDSRAGTGLTSGFSGRHDSRLAASGGGVKAVSG